MSTRVHSAIFLVALMISWAGCDTVVAEPARTYKIGVVLGLTGAAATWSESARQGLEMAQEEINQSGGIRGRRLDLLFEDSGTEAARSVSAYKKLVEVQGVRIIVGDIWAHLINAILPLAEKDRVLLIAPTVSDDDPALKGQYFFTMGNRVNSVRRAVSQFFEINPEVKRVGILCFDNSWGHAYSKMWHEVATENGVTVVGEVCSFGFTDTHRTEIAKFRALGADAIIAAEWTDQVLKTMKEQRMASKLLGTSNVTEALYVRNSSNDLMEGTFFTDWSPSDEFISRFKQRYGKDPILGAHNAYEILRSIAKALTISDQDVASALRTVHYEGVGGSIDFRNGMFANMSVGSLFTVKSRKVVAIQ